MNKVFCSSVIIYFNLNYCLKSKLAYTHARFETFCWVNVDIVY